MNFVFMGDAAVLMKEIFVFLFIHSFIYAHIQALLVQIVASAESHITWEEQIWLACKLSLLLKKQVVG